MPLTDIPDLADIPAADVTSLIAELTARMAARFPTYDVARGAFRDMVIRPDAYAIGAIRLVVDRLIRSGSLGAIAADPALADDALVDRVLANYLLERRSAALASGTITVVLEAAVPITLPAGTAFVTDDGLRFVTASSHAARLSEALVTGDTDRVIRPLPDGRYAFTVPAVAAAPGVNGLIRRGRALTPATPLFRVAGAYAEADFSGGADAETNADLLQRLRDGAAARTPSNRMTIRGMIRGSSDFVGVGAVSVLGFGDPEQARDQRGVLPIAVGGRVDVLARTAPLPGLVVLEKVATYIGRIGGVGAWQFGIERGDAPGFYEITQVADPGTAPDAVGYEIQADLRSVDVTGLAPGDVPDIGQDDPEAAAFSPYQTATVRVLIEAIPPGAVVGTTTRTLQVVVLAMPGLAGLQAFLSDRSRRDPASDLLVRAPSPCFVTLTVSLLRPASGAEPDTAVLAQAAADRVNSLGFAGRLAASDLAALMLPLMPAGWQVSRVLMTGRILMPRRVPWAETPRFRLARAVDVLEVPDEPARGITPRTVCFFLDPADVAIAIEPLNLPEV